MNRIVELLKNNKIVQGAIVLGGVAAAAYFMFSGDTKIQQTAENNYEQMILEAIQQAKIIEVEGYKLYDLESASRFQDILVELAIPEFRYFARQNREERRKLMNTDRNKYFDMIVEYNDKMLSLIGLQQEKLKQFPGYSEEAMSISISILSKDNRYMQKIIQSISMLKSSLEIDQDLTKEDAQSIIAYFVTFIKSQPEILVHLVKYLVQQKNSKGIIYPALKTALFDQLYLEKGFEEEEYLKPALLEDFQKDPLTQRIQQQYATTVNEFMDYHKF